VRYTLYNCVIVLNIYLVSDSASDYINIARSVGQTENQQSGQTIDWSQFTVPPGLSDYAFKRVIGENPPTAEQLEQIKLGIVKFLAGGFFPDTDILIHLIVAAADTRFSIANMADLELKKIIGCV